MATDDNPTRAEIVEGIETIPSITDEDADEADGLKGAMLLGGGIGMAAALLAQWLGLGGPVGGTLFGLGLVGSIVFWLWTQSTMIAGGIRLGLISYDEYGTLLLKRDVVLGALVSATAAAPVVLFLGPGLFATTVFVLAAVVGVSLAVHHNNDLHGD